VSWQANGDNNANVRDAAYGDTYLDDNNGHHHHDNDVHDNIMANIADRTGHSRLSRRNG